MEVLNGKISRRILIAGTGLGLSIARPIKPAIKNKNEFGFFKMTFIDLKKEEVVTSGKSEVIVGEILRYKHNYPHPSPGAEYL